MWAGALVGTMLLVKPHALAMFMAVLLTFGAIFIAPSAVRPGRRRLLAGVALFIVSTYVTLVSLNSVLTGQFQPHPLTFVGGIYQPYLSQGVSLSSWTGSRGTGPRGRRFESERFPGAPPFSSSRSRGARTIRC